MPQRLKGTGHPRSQTLGWIYNTCQQGRPIRHGATKFWRYYAGGGDLLRVNRSFPHLMGGASAPQGSKIFVWPHLECSHANLLAQVESHIHHGQPFAWTQGYVSRSYRNTVHFDRVTFYTVATSKTLTLNRTIVLRNANEVQKQTYATASSSFCVCLPASCRQQPISFDHPSPSPYSASFFCHSSVLVKVHTVSVIHEARNIFIASVRGSEFIRFRLSSTFIRSYRIMCTMITLFLFSRVA